MIKVLINVDQISSYVVIARKINYYRLMNNTNKTWLNILIFTLGNEVISIIL